MRHSLFLGLFLSAALVSGEAAAAKSSWTYIIYNEVTYKSSNDKTCRDGVKALYYQNKYWCPVTTTTASSGGTTSGSGSTGSTGSTGGTTTTPTSYTAKLSWSIPATRADGTALLLSELAGYEIYYTNDAGTVSQVVNVAGGSTVSTSITSLSSGNYSFAVSAIDTNGLKSSLSAVASVSFP